MTRERTARRRARDTQANTADPNPRVSRAVALTGLASALLGAPLAVLASPMGPYDDPKTWALSLLMALTGLAWMAGARRPSAPAFDRPGRVVAGLVILCTAWSLLATVTSVAPVQSLLGTFGRGVGLLTIALTALAFFVVRTRCRTPGAIGWIIDVALL